ncbi:MAG: carboxypeptidase regulatory-like domain-containing protein, partial [archaeon]|nr:carboxypeptidase regulatory-like domain-containing protein [archaeon]
MAIEGIEDNGMETLEEGEEPLEGEDQAGKNPLQSIIDPIKKFYFSLEDKYYAVLDELDKSIPVYKVVDPIDKIFPSFILLIILVLLLLLGIGILLLGAVSPQSTVFVVVDEDGSPIDGASVNVTFDDGTAQGFVTGASGEFSLVPKGKTLTVEVDLDGYEHYSEVFEVDGLIRPEIILKEAAPEFSQKVIQIKDSEGEPLSGTQIRFTCSENYAAPRTISSASSEETVSYNSQCGVLTAHVSLAGYEEKSRALVYATTVINLESIGDAVKGKVRVTVIDADSGDGAGDIVVKLYAPGNVQVSQGSTDSRGFFLFDVNPGNYYVRALDNRAVRKYNDERSENFQLNAGAEESVTIELQKVTSGGKKNKILVKFIDSQTEAPISGVSVQFYADGDAVQIYSSGADGTVSLTNADTNAEYSLVATHSNYVAKAAIDLNFIDAASSDAQEIELVKKTSTNSGNVLVEVKSSEGNMVSGAQVLLFAEDLNFYFQSGTTDSDGEITFTNLPLAEYYAKATHTGRQGTSETAQLSAGAALKLTITMALTTGSIKAIVVDTQGNPVSGARVEFFDPADDAGTGIAVKITDLDGETDELALDWDISPYLKVTKEGYFPLRTTTYPIAPDSTTTARIVLRAEDDTSRLTCGDDGELCIGIRSIVENDSSRDVPSKLRAGGKYVLLFDVIAANGLDDVRSVVRAGLQEQMTANDSIVVIEKVNSNIAANVKYSSYDPNDAYAGVEETNGDGKQTIISFHDIDAGEYVFEVEVEVKDTAQNGDAIEIRYGAKSGNIYVPSQSQLVLWSYEVGEDLPCDPVFDECKNFAFEATLTGGGLADALLLKPSVPVLLQEENEYTLFLGVVNQHEDGTDFENVALEAQSKDGAIDISPESVEIEEFPFAGSYGAEFNLSPSGASASSRVEFALDLQETDNSVEYDFYMQEERTMTIVVSPTAIAPNTDSTITVTLADSETNEPITDAAVVYSTNSDYSSPTAIPAVAGTAGAYSFTKNAPNAGTTFYILASKAGYLAANGAVSVTIDGDPPCDDPAGCEPPCDSPECEPPCEGDGCEPPPCEGAECDPDGDGGGEAIPVGFECVGISTESIGLNWGDDESFTVTANDCPKDVEVAFFVPSAQHDSVPDEYAGPITLKNSSGAVLRNCNTSCINATLTNSSPSFTVKAFANKLLGQYDVLVKLRYKADAGQDVDDVRTKFTVPVTISKV